MPVILKPARTWSTGARPNSSGGRRGAAGRAAPASRLQTHSGAPAAERSSPPDQPTQARPASMYNPIFWFEMMCNSLIFIPFLPLFSCFMPLLFKCVFIHLWVNLFYKHGWTQLFALICFFFLESFSEKTHTNPFKFHVKNESQPKKMCPKLMDASLKDILSLIMISCITASISLISQSLMLTSWSSWFLPSNRQTNTSFCCRVLLLWASAEWSNWFLHSLSFAAMPGLLVVLNWS